MVCEPVPFLVYAGNRMSSFSCAFSFSCTLFRTAGDMLLSDTKTHSYDRIGNIKNKMLQHIVIGFRTLGELWAMTALATHIWRSERWLDDKVLH